MNEPTDFLNVPPKAHPMPPKHACTNARRCLTTAIILLTTLYTSSAFAGAWAQPDKGAYLKASYGLSTGENQYKDRGDVFPMLSEDIDGYFLGMGAFIYAEFGLFPRLTVFGSTAYQQLVLESDFQKATTTGFGDLTLGARYQFIDNPAVFSFSMAAKLPTGYSPDLDIMTPTLGNGVYEVDMRLLVGKSFYPFPMYVSAEGGYRYRGQRMTSLGTEVDYADELPYAAEIGYSLTNWVLLRGTILGVYGLGNPQSLDIFSLTPIAQSYTKVGPSVIFTIAERYQLNADYAYTVAGINTVKSHDFSLGFAITFGQ